MLHGYVTLRETSFTIHCHDRTLKRITVLGDDSQPLFRVEGTALGKSWSIRRKIVDGAGRHVCDFRHHNFDLKSNGWVVEEAGGRKVCELAHTSVLRKGHAAVTAKVRTTAGENVTVEMTPSDSTAVVTRIHVDGCTFATINKIADNIHSTRSHYGNPEDMTAWKVRVAAGVDLSLVSARYIYVPQAVCLQVLS